VYAVDEPVQEARERVIIAMPDGRNAFGAKSSKKGSLPGLVLVFKKPVILATSECSPISSRSPSIK